MPFSSASSAASVHTSLQSEQLTEAEETWAGKHIVITGGAGFIGSTLALRLADLGSLVTVIDSLVPEYGGNLFNLQDCKDHIHINYSDIRDTFSLQPLLRDVDILFSLAGQTSHMDSMTDPHSDLNINCAAQLNLLETCRRINPTIRIVFASTRQIYGRPQYLPVDERHPIAPVDINGIHKYAAEQYYGLYHNLYGIRSCILRLTNTIGPRMRIKDARQTFLGIWVRHLLEDNPIEVWGGEQLRDFNDVEDVVDALLTAAWNENSYGHVFNLGSEQKVSLRELAERMISLHGSGELEIKDYPEERRKIDIGDYYSSHDKFTASTGWKPLIPLDRTLDRTIAFFQQNLSHYL